MSQYTDLTVKMCDLTEPEVIARFQLDEEKLRELAASIERLGLINPITVKAKGKKFEIVAGHRRYKAMLLLGWTETRARVANAEGMRFEAIKAAENLMREDLHVLEEAETVRLLIEEQKISIHQTAEFLNRSIGWVQLRIEILNYPKDLIIALGENRITQGQAQILARIEEEKDRVYFTNQCVDSGATQKTLRMWWVDYEKIKHYLPADTVIEEWKKTRDDGETNLSFVCQLCGDESHATELHMVRACFHCFSGIAHEERERLRGKIPGTGRSGDISDKSDTGRN